MRKSNSILTAGTLPGVLGCGLLALIGASVPMATAADEVPNQPDTPANATYTWSAELVAFDRASNTVTVKSSFVTNPEAADLAALKPGDRAMLTWSGLSMAAGIRALERGHTSSFDRLTMPVEYVASELDGRYVSFKVPIPVKDTAAIAELSPGTWVTATSPVRAKSLEEAVGAIRPYNDVD
jgi:hypothetical protein